MQPRAPLECCKQSLLVDSCGSSKDQNADGNSIIKTVLMTVQMGMSPLESDYWPCVLHCGKELVHILSMAWDFQWGWICLCIYFLRLNLKARVGWVVQVVEHLPNKYKALCLNPSTPQKVTMNPPKQWTYANKNEKIKDDGLIILAQDISGSSEFRLRHGYCWLFLARFIGNKNKEQSRTTWKKEQFCQKSLCKVGAKENVAAEDIRVIKKMESTL
jgi:hypothetical protein